DRSRATRASWLARVEQLFDARQMRVESLAITDRHPGKRFGDFPDPRLRRVRKVFLPILVGTQRRHPTGMGCGQFRIARYFNQPVKIHSAVRDVPGELAVSAL